MRLPACVRPAAALLLLGGMLVPAHAGLFDDEEARKAIVDLRGRLTAVEDASKTRITELSTANAQLLEQLAATRRSLVELNNQLETLRSELATLRGNNEQMLRDLAEVQKRQKDVSQAFDDRLRALEPAKVVIDGREATVPPDQKRAYDEAIAAIRGGDFDRSVSLLTSFQRKHADSAYNDSVRFWLGNAFYGKRDYKEAIAAFRSFIAGAGNHPRAPEAMLALANSQAEMKDARGARKTIEELMKTYPKSEAAQAGKERLASIR